MAVTINGSGTIDGSGGFGAWTSYTPVLTQGVTVTLSANSSAYTQIGKTVFVRVFITASSAGTAANTITVSLPVTAKSGLTNSAVGSFRYFDAGVAHYVGTVTLESTSTVSMYRDNSSGTLVSPTVASTDSIYMTITYEAA